MEKIPCIECDDKLFKYIEPFLKKWGYDFYHTIFDWNTLPILVLNYVGDLGDCTNVEKEVINHYNRELVTDVEEFLERAAELKGFIYKKKQKDMKLSDLKSGMVVRTREKGSFLVLFVNDEIIFSSIDYWISSSNYNEDLTHSSFSELTIIEVLVPESKTTIPKLLDLDYPFLKSIWKREEALEVTMEEIAKKFGVNEIKIKQ